MIVGGAQENTLLTCRGLAARPDYDVTLATGPALGPEGNLLDTPGLAEKFRLVLIPQLRRDLLPLHDLVAFFKLWRFFRREKFDIVHTHSSKAGILGRWAAKLAGVPQIFHTVHGWGFHDYQKRWKRNLFIFLERRTARITAKLVTVSQENTRKGLEAGIGSPDQYLTIYSGIDPAAYQKGKNLEKLRDSLGFPKGDLLVGTVGRFVDQKNPLFFVRIAGRLRRNHPNLFFIFVGDGPLRPQVEKEKNLWKLGSALCLTGIRRDAPDLTQLFDIFLLPSRWEGLPRALLGAMAAGKAVVASRTDGNREVIEHGKNGLLVDIGDEEEWVRAAEMLIAQPELRRRLGEEAQKTITDRFSDVKMLEDLVKLYGGI